MTTKVSQRIKWMLVATIGMMLIPSLGCIGATAQLLYMIRGVKVDAEFDELKGKRVAVVCVSDASQYGPDRASEALARFVESTLKRERAPSFHKELAWEMAHP